MEVKGVLLAGGLGSRLFPFTEHTNKTLLTLNDRPVIDFAMDTFRRSGIKEIIIIGNRFIQDIIEHVGEGAPDEVIHYVEEHEPEGVVNAINLARPFVEGCRMMLYFSDNITNWDFTDDVQLFSKDDILPPGAVILLRRVNNPSEFGVCAFSSEGDLIDIVEKPVEPPSNMAVGGIYLYDELFWEFLDLKASEKSEDITISDLNRVYLGKSNVHIRDAGDMTWIDCGTPEGLRTGSRLVKDGIISIGNRG